MKDDSQWGDQNTLQALSDKLGIKIDVTKVGHTFLVKPSEGPVNGEIHLGLHGESHYYSLERSEYSLIQRKNISIPLLADLQTLQAHLSLYSIHLSSCAKLTVL